MAKLLCSTGTLVGKSNGFQPEIIRGCAPSIQADGLELIIVSPWYADWEQTLRTLQEVPLPYYSLHADKNIGTAFSEGDFSQGLRLFRQNCEAAVTVGAKLVVLHLWGGPLSDTNFNALVTHVPSLYQISAEHGLCLTLENVPCTCENPLSRLEWLAKEFSFCLFTLDTRFAAFHAQAEDIFTSALWSRTAHMHVSNYKGGQRDWASLGNILHPGEEGLVHLPAWFQAAKAHGYQGAFTLESPVIAPEPDIAKLNASLLLVRTLLQQATL